MDLLDKLTAKCPAAHFSVSDTQTMIEEDGHLATTRKVTFEHIGTAVLKIDKSLFVVERDALQATADSAPVEVCDGAIATEIPHRFIGYVELKSKCSQNKVIKARGQIMASYHHMLAIERQ